MMISDEWTNTRLADFFERSTEKGTSNLPLLSVTLNNGLVRRDSLERKMDTNLSAEEHLLVREGYLAYNMMRMWQGASGKAACDGIVSPAYVVLKTKQNMHSTFASQWFKSARMVYLFWAYSYGLTEDRLRLYFKDFCVIPVMVPPLREQKLIADILSTWDRAIEKTECLIKAKENRFAWLLNKLINQGSEKGEWKKVKLGDVLTYEQPTRYLVSNKNYNASFDTPVLTAGKTFILGYTNETNGIYDKKLPVIIFDDFTTASKLVDFPFKAKSSAMKVLSTKNSEDSIELIFAAISLIKFNPKGHKRHWISVFQHERIRLPKPKEQKHIAEILNTAQQEIELLKTLADKYKDQKRGLMQKLLTGTWRVNEKIINKQMEM